MWTSWSHVLSFLTEAYSGPKGRSILCNNNMEVEFREIKRIVYAETLLNYPDCKILFTVYTDASDKQLGAVISQNHKPIALFSIKLSKPHHDYTSTYKELLLLVECLK